MEEGDVVELEIMHRAAHAGEAFAEAEIVSGVFFGRFAFGPVPIPAVLEVDDVKGMVVDDGAAVLQADVVDATDAFFEDLRGHDGGADGEDEAAFEIIHGSAEETEVDVGGAPNGGTVEHGVIGDDVVADAGMDGEGNTEAKGVAED